MDLTAHPLGLASLAVFCLGYALVAAEEWLHLRKSIPMIVSAGVIWLFAAMAYAGAGQPEAAAAAIRHNLLEFAELFLFLLAAVTYVNTMEERQLFDALRAWLVRRGLSLRALFWTTGALAFTLSPFLDNLTTSLVMGAVVLAIARSEPGFVALACIHIVVAANAGGAFSPFGDITTLMVWQKGVVPFGGFLGLFVPSLVNWAVPAALMSLAIRSGRPQSRDERVRLRPGARGVAALFAGTISLTVSLHHFYHLPPVLGMMTGLGVLKLYSFALQRAATRARQRAADTAGDEGILSGFGHRIDPSDSFDIYGILQRVEWDTLMFFYGVILCVGGLGAFGFLVVTSRVLYDGLGPTTANVLVGLLSAVVDNIPVMFAVLSMEPDMNRAQWLLVTLTAGVGGSLLSVGSAAGVALMGQARGLYTFFSHLRWAWAVALGYAASIGTHLLINGR